MATASAAASSRAAAAATTGARRSYATMKWADATREIRESGRRNKDPHFVGLKQLKRKQADQLALFEDWAAARTWSQFHKSHYDWWVAPLGSPSKHGCAYTVYEDDIADLKADAEFARRHLRGIELVALSWGWSLAEAAEVPSPAKTQRWHNWPIRLFKCATSLAEFGYQREFESLQTYGRQLLAAGWEFEYGRDLSWLFTHEIVEWPGAAAAGSGSAVAAGGSGTTAAAAATTVPAAAAAGASVAPAAATGGAAAAAAPRAAGAPVAAAVGPAGDVAPVCGVS